MVGVDALPDAAVVLEGHYPSERLLDRNPAGCALSGLKDDEQDRFAEIAHLLYLGVKPTDGLREAFEKCADLAAAVVRADLVLKLDLWMDKGVELRTQLAGRTRSTFSSDIAYSDITAASRASSRV